MTYSRAHRRLCELSGSIKNFTIFGPNYETVLNYWKWIDRLSKEQWKIVVERHSRMEKYSLYAAANDSRKACRIVTSYYGEVYYATEYSVENSSVFGASGKLQCRAKGISREAILEILSMHILLEQGKKLVYIPLFDNL
jgi:hypothetical protein